MHCMYFRSVNICAWSILSNNKQHCVLLSSALLWACTNLINSYLVKKLIQDYSLENTPEFSEEELFVISASDVSMYCQRCKGSFVVPALAIWGSHWASSVHKLEPLLMDSSDGRRARTLAKSLTATSSWCSKTDTIKLMWYLSISYYVHIFNMAKFTITC